MLNIFSIASLFAVSQAHAALPTGASSFFTGIEANFSEAEGYAWPLMLTVYGAYILIGLMGTLIKKHKSLETVVAGSLVASVIFFLATNLAVWQFSPWYAKSLSGLIQCYTLALPFFRNTLMGDLFYVSVLFGAYEAVRLWVCLGKKRFYCCPDL